jgi:putative addiction module killer protein
LEKKLVIFETDDGKCPFSDWLDNLRDRKARGIIRARLNRVQLGNLGDCKSVGDGVFELRVAFGPGYRVYFGQEGEWLVVLLCGGDKTSQDKDIERAKQFWEDFKNAS